MSKRLVAVIDGLVFSRSIFLFLLPVFGRWMASFLLHDVLDGIFVLLNEFETSTQTHRESL